MVQIRRVSALDEAELRGLCELLVDAVDGGASVGFLSPLAMETAGAYWRSVAEALSGGLVLLVAEEGGRIVGSAQLAPCPKENGKHRAEVQKLFVLRSHRGNGVASQLMEAVEQAARSLGRTLLILDTLSGSKAESVYAHLGWTRAGEIPDYAAHPDGRLHATVIFYKRLAPLQ